MKVYVVFTWWDTDQDEGRELLGVYANRDDARLRMLEDVAIVKDEYAKHGQEWDKELCAESEDSVYLADGLYTWSNTFGWEILEAEVQ